LRKLIAKLVALGAVVVALHGCDGCIEDYQCPLTCGGKCVDPFTDVNNCGDCDKACGSGQVCLDGACSLPPAP